MSSMRQVKATTEGTCIKATIWIAVENEIFWENLPNKSGWVNTMIDTLLREQYKLMEAEKKYEKHEETMVQDTPTETKS